MGKITENDNVCVLISCMHQDKEIIQRSNVHTDVVVVNQCDTNFREEFIFQDSSGREHRAVFINTTERGLSVSRNMAVNNSLGDICLVCDDDELLVDDLEIVLKRAYLNHPDAAVITFMIECEGIPNNFPTEEKRMNVLRIQKTSSQQISFRRSKLFEKGIAFDEKMGSGTGNGGGEENKLLNDCRRKGLELYFVPNKIATILPGESKWFAGRTAKWFANLGWTNRRIHGLFWSYIYIWYWIFSHESLFSTAVRRKEVTIWGAVSSYYKGVFSKR